MLQRHCYPLMKQWSPTVRHWTCSTTFSSLKRTFGTPVLLYFWAENCTNFFFHKNVIPWSAAQLQQLHKYAGGGCQTLFQYYNLRRKSILFLITICSVPLSYVPAFFRVLTIKTFLSNTFKATTSKFAEKRQSFVFQKTTFCVFTKLWSQHVSKVWGLEKTLKPNLVPLLFHGCRSPGLDFDDKILSAELKLFGKQSERGQLDSLV